MNRIHDGGHKGSGVPSLGPEGDDVLEGDGSILLIDAVENSFVANVLLGDEADAFACTRDFKSLGMCSREWMSLITLTMD